MDEISGIPYIDEGLRAGMKRARWFDLAPGEVSLPVAFTVFPGENFQARRTRVEKVYPNLIYLNEVDKGTAWEEPELFATEVRAAFRSLR